MAELMIITLSRNQAYFEQLDDCLAAQVSAPSSRRFLINNSNDPRLTASALKRGWLVVEPGYNTSFSTGNNLAAKALDAYGDGARHLLLLNDDIRCEPPFLYELWRQRETADILGALLLHTDRTVNHAGSYVYEGGAIDHIGRGLDPEQYRGRCYLVPAVTFAAALIYRGLWEKLGGLDERYYYGWEDADFCMRTLQAGGTIRCNGDAVAVHDECGTRSRTSPNNVTNYNLFLSAWQRQLPELLADYRHRMRPETVEGV
jgi:GT2 family glycosyltransferase